MKTYTVTAILGNASYINSRFDTLTKAYETAIKWSESTWHTANGKYPVIAVFVAGSDWPSAENYTISELKAAIAHGEPQRIDARKRPTTRTTW